MPDLCNLNPRSGSIPASHLSINSLHLIASPAVSSGSLRLELSRFKSIKTPSIAPDEPCALQTSPAVNLPNSLPSIVIHRRGHNQFRPVAPIRSTPAQNRGRKCLTTTTTTTTTSHYLQYKRHLIDPQLLELRLRIFPGL